MDRKNNMWQYSPAGMCEQFYRDALHAKARGRRVILPTDPGLRKCVKDKLAKHEKLEQAKQYDPIAWKLLLKYPIITDADLRKKIHEQLPNDPTGQQYVFSLVRSRAYKATAFSGAKLKAMTHFMEATTQENQNRHRRLLETIPQIQDLSEMNNRKRALFKKLNARHAALRATWAARKTHSKKKA
jgi:hypothetical protein